MTCLNDLKNSLVDKFGGSHENIVCYFSPGRVNLIGEHIDYNGGFVFPAALSIGIYASVRKRNDDIIKLQSLNLPGEIVINTKENIKYDEIDNWGNYPKGVIKTIIEEGYCPCGADILFSSSLPDGAGLSSSAALEVLTGYIMYDLCGVEDIDRVKLALMCQKVENRFIGVNCGIMDQFSVATGKRDNAILLDCNSLKYEYVPFVLGKFSLIIINTNKKRELADSKYNERRAECERALSIIKGHKNINNLCEATLKDVKDYISEELLVKRARHVVSENERVKSAVEVLKKGDIKGFGELMTASHNSLEYDYEVTGNALDTIVEEALKVEGCIGARMTGAGFGGCAIAIVENDSIEDFKEKVSHNYKEKIGLNPDFYVSVIDDGVKRLL